MKNVLLIIIVMMMGCKENNTTPLGDNNLKRDSLIDINFLIDYFEIDPLHRDKIMLEKGYKLGNAWNYKGFEKGNVFSKSKNYEFAYYDEGEDKWVAYLTNNPEIILSILNSIETNKKIEKIDTSKYSTGEYNIESSKSTLFGEDVYLTVLRRNEK